MTRTRLTGLALLLLTACRFGGSNGDALALVEPHHDGGSDAAEMDSSEANGDGDQEPAPEPSDASAPGPTRDGSVNDADAGGDASEVEICERPSLLGCDPVLNVGCAAGVTQCVVDPESSEPAGRCIFSGILATPCEESALSTSCSPQHACAAGTCRKYCFCDTDCDDGERCSEPVESVAASGVRLCASSEN
jgi:hypothetical protein